MRLRGVTGINATVGLGIGLLCAVIGFPLQAQTGVNVHAGRGLVARYDAAHETTVSGVVQDVVTKHTIGSPAGMHLLVSGTNGMVDAHVGPFLDKDTREALHLGLPIEIVGAMQELNGKQFLMARELKFGGRTLTIRNKNGFLEGPQHERHAHRATAVKTVDGGAR